MIVTIIKDKLGIIWIKRLLLDIKIYYIHTLDVCCAKLCGWSCWDFDAETAKPFPARQKAGARNFRLLLFGFDSVFPYLFHWLSLFYCCRSSARTKPKPKSLTSASQFAAQTKIKTKNDRMKIKTRKSHLSSQCGRRRIQCHPRRHVKLLPSMLSFSLMEFVG